MDAYFPNVMTAFREISVGYYKMKKGIGKRKWKPGDQVSPFAHVTQGLESEMILNRIVPKIISFNPSIPLFSIHDCIMTTEGYKDEVRQIMESEFQETFGIAPGIEEE